MEYPSAIKYNEILLLTTICTWKVLCLLKYQRLYFIPYMLNLKNKTKQNKKNQQLMNTKKTHKTHRYRVQTHGYQRESVQFSSIAQSCPTLCDPMNLSMPGLPAHYQLQEFTQTHVHRVSDGIQPSHAQGPHPGPLLSLHLSHLSYQYLLLG